MALQLARFLLLAATVAIAAPSFVVLSAASAYAGGFREDSEADKANDDKAGDDARKGFEAYRKRDYRKARPFLEKAAEAGDAGADTCRSFLARICYFYAEDDL